MSVKAKPSITDSEIIALYRAGWSQNDISSRYDVSVIYTRGVLQDAGFNTRGYRALSPTATRIIPLLVKAGVYYRDIETVTDLSFHAIRDYVNRMGFAAKTGVRGPVLPPTVKSSFPKMSAFRSGYLEGESFCSLVLRLNLSNKDILKAYCCIEQEDVIVHRKALQRIIQEAAGAGLSHAGISRKLDISRSIVRDYFPRNKEQRK